MIFGLFSSFVPYLIAAGLYIIYLMISLLQPVSGNSEEMETTPENIVIQAVDQSDHEKREISSFQFENYKYGNQFFSYNTGAPFYNDYEPPLPDSLALSPAYGNWLPLYENSVRILTSLFFRPPPMC